ncbi:hypothetical protein STEG23_030576, partial [Scotinomys teguina]
PVTPVGNQISGKNRGKGCSHHRMQSFPASVLFGSTELWSEIFAAYQTNIKGHIYHTASICWYTLSYHPVSVYCNIYRHGSQLTSLCFGMIVEIFGSQGVQPLNSLAEVSSFEPASGAAEAGEIARDAASLSYNITIRYNITIGMPEYGSSESGSWWQKVRGQLNTELFISCDNDCRAIGALGTQLSATNIWLSQVDALKDAVNMFKAEVAHMNAENNTMTDSLMPLISPDISSCLTPSSEVSSPPVSRKDAHSLNCNILVRAPQPWCEGQCSLDGEPFLQYDCDNKATPMGDLGKAARATQMGTDFVQELESLGQELKKILANTKLVKTKIG